jgi:hypothetical protein
MAGEHLGPSPEDLGIKKSTPPERKLPEKQKVVVVEMGETLAQHAREEAESRLTAARKELRGLTGAVKRVWKYNLFHEYYRNKEISRARQQIIESGNIYAATGADKSQHDIAVKSIVDRFTSEYDEAIHTEAGEVREKLDDRAKKEQVNQTKTGIKELVSAFASGRLNDEQFAEEKNRLLSKMHGVKYQEVPVRYADNLLTIAKNVKANLAHGQGIEALDLDFDIVVGRAQLGARTETHYNRLDRVIERVQRSRVGQFVNETTVASAVSIAYSLSGGLATRIASSRALALASFGGTAVLAGGIAGAREKKRVDEERAQHARDLAVGKRTSAEAAPRREEMERARYETREAAELVRSLRESLYAQKDEQLTVRDLSQQQFEQALGALAEIEARVAISDRHKVDVVSYSHPMRVEQERFDMDVARARAKVDIAAALQSSGGRLTVPEGRNFFAYQEALRDARVSQLIHGQGGLQEKDSLYRSLRRKKVAGAVFKGIASGLVVGVTAQEAIAFARSSQTGFLEQLISPKGTRGTKINLTGLEYLKRYMLGQLPDRLDPAAIHTVKIGTNQLELPEGVNLSRLPGGRFALAYGGEVIASDITFDKTGRLTAGARGVLADHGINVHEASRLLRRTVNESVTTGPQEWLAARPNLTQSIKRVLWYDNDTPKPVFDKNELKLWWGGNRNTGIDASGNYVFNVKHMAPDGSFHSKLSVDAQRAMSAGNLKMLLSLSRDTQQQVVAVAIGPDGNARIDPTSEIGKLFFKTVGGKAQFAGRFAEVAQVVGTESGVEQMRILATHEGKGIESLTKMISREIHERTPRTILDIPVDYTVEPPPVIPILGRYPLEPARYSIDYLGGYFRDDARNREHYRERRSKNFTSPDARLNHYNEAQEYLSRQAPERRRRTQELAAQIEAPMDAKCRMVVCIPAAGHQEGKNMYRSLEAYSNQKMANGKKLDPRQFEVLVFVNHPKDRTPDDTRGEVLRFQKDHPEMNVRLVYDKIDRSEATIGNIRKLATDVALLRHHARGAKVKDIILISNDADNKGIDSRYLSNFLDKFDKNERIDAVLGKIDWEPAAYVQSPILHVGTRFFQYLDIVYRHHTSKTHRSLGSSGANFAMRGSIYAGVGGYLEDDTVAEDRNLGSMIKLARQGAKEYPIAYGGAHSLVNTSARRSVAALKQGRAPAEQWDDSFGPDNELRAREWAIENKASIKELLTGKENLEKMRAGIEAVINRTLRVYRLSASSWEARKSLGLMGVAYRVDNERVVVTDISKVVERLKKYQSQVNA